MRIPTIGDWARSVFGVRPQPRVVRREKRTPAAKKRFVFIGPGIESVEIEAHTKGEARAALKRLLKVAHLPVGTKGRRLTARVTADALSR